MRLATFVHVSDLHFGHLDPVTLNAKAPGLWAKHSAFDGLLGHSYNALRKLETFFDQMRRTENAQLIVTGDLTTVGHPDQFAMASDFLGSILRFSRGRPIGLMEKHWTDRGVPGNHDHWPGHAGIWGGPTHGLAATFPAMPYFNDPPLSLPSGHVLRFMGIDTDADVDPYGTDRFLARGSFTSHLGPLATSLSIPTDNEIRVLCLHHSQELRGVSLEMNALSRDALNDFIVDQDIAVLLCGHVHTPPLVKSFTATNLGTSVDFLEARCGTTTQTSTLPYTWRTILGRRPKRVNRMPNSLLVHRLVMEGGDIYWHTELYQERSRGFAVPTPIPPGILVNDRVKVWPRP
jgi:3',5'-cyclic AMP phosphodiesterase CpdA